MRMVFHAQQVDKSIKRLIDGFYGSSRVDKTKSAEVINRFSKNDGKSFYRMKQLSIDYISSESIKGGAKSIRKCSFVAPVYQSKDEVGHLCAPLVFHGVRDCPKEK